MRIQLVLTLFNIQYLTYWICKKERGLSNQLHIANIISLLAFCAFFSASGLIQNMNSRGVPILQQVHWGAGLLSHTVVLCKVYCCITEMCGWGAHKALSYIHKATGYVGPWNLNRFPWVLSRETLAALHELLGTVTMERWRVVSTSIVSVLLSGHASKEPSGDCINPVHL